MPYFGEQKREYARKWVAARRAAWFADKVCVVCGTNENLELHHINPETKVSHNIWSWSFVRRDEELLKCEVRCTEHHMVKTKEQLSFPLIHGTAEGYRKLCRCRPCTDAASAERQQYKVARKLRLRLMAGHRTLNP